MARVKGKKQLAASPPPTFQGGPQSFHESLAQELYDTSVSLASFNAPTRALSKNPLYNQNKNLNYQQINKGVMPFNLNGGSNYIDIQNIIELCQKAYFNVSVFRNTIDTMTEFSNSELFFKGGNDKTRKFFANWFTKIGGHGFADKFFREWFRSGNIVLYRFDGDVLGDILKQIKTIYGADNKITQNVKIPVRYAILNPAYLRSEYGFNLSSSISNFYLVLTQYECQRLKTPITEEDIALKNSLSSDQIKQIESGAQVFFPLDAKKTHAIFCKKQDYEPFAVPMFFPVLTDIDLKLLYKGVERVLARTVEYVILLIKVGTEDNPNPAALEAMQELMRNETLGRVLVADGTTSMEFVIPDLNKVLGPEKYKQINEDIANGLMNIFASDEKFSSTSIKIKVFMERLNESRRAFLDFINGEIKRISQEIGFKSFPHAEMAQIDINDANLFQKVVIQLGQLGMLTSPQVLEALQTSYIPTAEESLEAQEEFKKLRDKGLYEPLIGGAKDPAENGRPSGSTGIKQQTQKISPVGTSKASEINDRFDIKLMSEVLKKTNIVYANLESAVKKHFKVKKLKDDQRNVINDILTLIVANEPEDNWLNVIDEYVENPKIMNPDRAIEIDNIGATYATSTFLSAILSHCKIKE